MANITAVTLNGQVGLVPSRQMLAAGGKYFAVTNPTPGTAIAYALQAAFSTTANGLFSISNNNPSGGANIQLDYLSLILTGTAPATTTVMRGEVYTENAVSAITTLVLARTPVNLNSGTANTTGAVVTSYAAGAGTVPTAVGTRRLVSVFAVPTSLGVTGDNYVIQFGPSELPAGSGQMTAVRATAACRIVTHTTPVTIAPQCTAFINLWWLTATTTAPSFEFELTYAEL